MNKTNFKMMIATKYYNILTEKVTINKLINEAKEIGLLLIVTSKELDENTVYIERIQIQELF